MNRSKAEIGDIVKYQIILWQAYIGNIIENEQESIILNTIKKHEVKLRDLQYDRQWNSSYKFLSS